jgi:hypothetical protein
VRWEMPGWYGSSGERMAGLRGRNCHVLLLRFPSQSLSWGGGPVPVLYVLLVNAYVAWRSLLSRPRSGASGCGCELAG